MRICAWDVLLVGALTRFLLPSLAPTMLIPNTLSVRHASRARIGSRRFSKHISEVHPHLHATRGRSLGCAPDRHKRAYHRHPSMQLYKLAIVLG